MVTYTSALTLSAAGVQTDADTVAATFKWFGKTQQFNLIDMNEVIKNRTQNLSREVYSIDKQRVTCRGTITHEVQDATFFLAGFGVLNTTGTDPYVHTFTTGEELVNMSFYHEKKFPGTPANDIRDIYTGAKINEFKLVCSEGGYLTLENDIWAIKYLENQSQETITASTTTPFRFADIVNGEITLNSVQHKIMNYEYSRQNNLIDEQAGEYSSEFDPQELNEVVTVGIRMRKTELRDLRRSAASVSLVIKWQKTVDDYIQLTHTGVVQSAPEDTGVEGTIDVSVTFEVSSTTGVVSDSNTTYTF